MDNSTETLGSRIKTLRLSQSLTQSEIAISIGVSKAAISQWELDIAVPQGDNIIRLAAHLGVTPAELLWGGSAAPAIPLDEERLTMALSCLDEAGTKFLRLPVPQRAKLVAYVYNRGEPLSMQELLAVITLVG